MPQRRSQATPSTRRSLERRLDRLQHGARRALAATAQALEGVRLAIRAYVRGLLGLRGLRLALNTAVAVLVISLPFAATADSRASAPAGPAAIGAVESAAAARAQPAARGAISAASSPVTTAATGTRPIQELVVVPDDTLGSIANYYGISIEALAFANGITDPTTLQLGQTLRIPPSEGALYTVAEGDSVESLASRFKVDPAVIMSYNRLYFEPEHSAPGQLIFVPGATLPALVEPERPVPAPRVVLAPAPVARSGRLAWPVGGVITQYFWWGHTGVDLAAPYGTGIAAAADGVVSATGWVAVGGLRVCLDHGGGLQTCYYHTGAVFVSPGQYVSRGQVIASIGMTGVTTGPHVHWECKVGGTAVNCLGL